MDKYSCNLCTATYGSNKSLYRHIRCKHPIGEGEKFTCVLCGYSTPRADSLKQHKNTVHQTVRESKVQCALCGFSSPTRKGIRQHYTVAHNLTIGEETHEFSSESRFYEWKQEVEKDTLSEFVCARGHWVKSASESSKLYFKCHRDGTYKSRGNNVRHKKILGSNKIDGHCPARMDVTLNPSGEVKVLFCSTHVGHQLEIGRLRLSKCDKELIAKKLAMKIPFDHILDEFDKYEIQESGLQRRNFLTRKDIHNIAESYNLKSEATRHSKVGNESESSNTDLMIYEACNDDNQHIIVKELQNPGSSRLCVTLEQRREQLLKQFNLCLDEAGSEEACDVIHKCLSSLMPTLQGMQSSSTLPAVSVSKASKCEPQKRFVPTKKKLEMTCLSIMKPDTSERKNIVTELLSTHRDE